jgi:hypothetical protein
MKWWHRPLTDKQSVVTTIEAASVKARAEALVDRLKVVLNELEEIVVEIPDIREEGT